MIELQCDYCPNALTIKNVKGSSLEGKMTSMIYWVCSNCKNENRSMVWKVLE